MEPRSGKIWDPGKVGIGADLPKRDPQAWNAQAMGKGATLIPTPGYTQEPVWDPSEIWGHPTWPWRGERLPGRGYPGMYRTPFW